MKEIYSIAFHEGGNEERFPDFSEDFPYIATRTLIDGYGGRIVPWHWHRAVELFYVESGTLECSTPGRSIVFPAGSGGMINSGVLHTSRALSTTEKNVPLVHLFNAELLYGARPSRIAERYILPLLSASRVEMLPLFPENEADAAILGRILKAFCIPEDEFGYELRVREALTEIWLMLTQRAAPDKTNEAGRAGKEQKIKRMLTYLQEHYTEKVSVGQLAQATFSSERECFRTFREVLHTTPTEYVTGLRLQKACRMLENRDCPITEIGFACGFGSSSYFGRVFRQYLGCTPAEYRCKWQDRSI